MLSEQYWYKWFHEDVSHICLCGNVLDIYLTLNHCLPCVMEAHCHMLGVLRIHRIFQILNTSCVITVQRNFPDVKV
jgi:hypothetical protein